ncbi:hypothetical protein Hanom_Chr15g01386131 [Helianthus anomalus]
MPQMYSGEFSATTFILKFLHRSPTFGVYSIANIRSVFLSLKAKGMSIHGSIVCPLFNTPFISIQRIFKL